MKEDLRFKAGGKYRAPRPFSVHHWDTFDNENIRMNDFETQAQAEAFVLEYYAGRLRGDGADRVHIVHNGTVVKQYSVG